MILEYILKYHLQDCLDILSNTDSLGYFTVKIDFLKLFEIYPDVGELVLCSPVETLQLCDKALVKAQQNLLENDEYRTKVSKCGTCTLKRNIHARFYGLPVCPELHRTILPKNIDLGCFLKVTGTIVRVTQTKMLEYHRKYVCVKCKYENFVEAEFEHRYILKAPTKCANDTGCKCTSFTNVNMVSREHCKDYQEIKIQEQVNKLSVGTIPSSMWVVLEDDLVDSCKPGDDVHICGTVRRRWRPSSVNKKCEVELVLQANYLEVCNAQTSEVISKAPDIKDCFDDYWSKYERCPLKGRDQILAAVCPQVYGLHLVKLALLLTVVTGSNHIVESEDEKKSSDEDKQTSRVRGQCHLLLVGDPGTGKSQLLRAGADLTPRSVFTSGAGSTRAGLTCSALREDGEWQLEAGALVLSDGGVCCIDEIGQLREHDRTSIHEAMEQQTISIAKAGIVCKLNTRCAVIAACNPKGHYQTDQPLSVNVSLGTPLLSRFDLIFILLDSKNRAWDKLVSSYIMFGGTNAAETDKKQWSLEKLQMYISLMGPGYTQMTKSANIILQTYYMAQRKSDFRDPSRTTVRMLDSLVRLSQAHCRLMYRTTILPMDAIMAVSLVDLSMQDFTLRDTVDALHSTFHKYPDFDYLCTAKKVLTMLNLFEIWKEELLYYAKVLQVDHKTLQSDIEQGSWQLFTKFDDVADDNISLSATLITSSYFNGKRDIKNNSESDINRESDREQNMEENKEVREKIVSTLKKHATLKTADINPPAGQKTKSHKRKRKEVTVKTNALPKNKSKKSKKTKDDKIMNDAENMGSNSDEENYAGNILNAVPSVNDVFTDLGIDFNFENSGNQQSILQIDELKLQNDNKHFCRSTSEEERRKDYYKESEENTSKIPVNKNIKSDTTNKLKQFQFIEKQDKCKLYEKILDKKECKATRSISSPSGDSAEKKTSLPSSQLSIFESSDCDVDIDL